MNAAPGVKAEGNPSAARFLSPRNLSRFRLLLTFVTFGAVAWYLHAGPPLRLSADGLRWGHLAAALACLPPILLLRAWKWKVLLRGAAPAARFGEAFRSYIGAMALALVTPAKLGELSRGMYLPHKAVQGWRGAGLVLIDNWIDFLAVAAWACIGWGLLYGRGALVAGAALALVFAPVPFWLRYASGLTGRLRLPAGFTDAARQGLDAAQGVSTRDYALAFGAGLAAYGCEWIMQAALIGFVAPAVPDFWRLTGALALVTLANSVQVTLAGLGVREGLSMLLVAGLGVAPEHALAGAFLASVLTLFLPALAGLAVRPAALYEKSP